MPRKKHSAEEIIGDPAIAETIPDRVTAFYASPHNAYRIELSGESLRKSHGQNGQA